MRVLIASVDIFTVASIKLTLAKENVMYDTTDLGEDGLHTAKLYDYDIILLDLPPPDIDGYGMLQRLRAARVDTPILILSGPRELSQRVKLLRFGADDFLTKPFDGAELSARIQAIVRRSNGHSQSTIRTGKLVVNLDTRVVSVDDQPVAAERPAIIVGQGVRYGGAAAELLQLAERLQIPVGASASGLGAIDCSHRLSLGLVSRGGLYQANGAMRQADVLLALGVRFDDRTSSSWIPGYSFTIPPTKLIHVDIDPDEIGRNYPVALGLMADVRTFLRQVLSEVEARKAPQTTPKRQAWLAQIEGWRREWEEAVGPGYADDATPINPQRAAHEINGALPEDAILVSDIGVHRNWLLHFCRPRRPDSLIGCMGFGPMGFGVAGVLGAKLAAPDRPCVSVCGDGAFFMHASVLGTAVEYGLPAVWVVWNNYSYASIRGLQRGYLGGRELATDFRHPETGEPYNPDFTALARACGIDSARIDRARQALSDRCQYRR